MEKPDDLAKKAPQGELFKAETTWFHVFKDMIDNGDMAKIEGSAIKCYLVIKSHTNFSTGRAFPALETIAEKAGLSDSQVKRSIKQLEDFGYIAKEKKGRHNVYTLREKVSINDEQGRPAAVATWDYLPSSVSRAMADLKNVLMTGDLAGAKIVHIERLNVQIVSGSNNSGVVQFNETDFAKLPPEMQDKMMAIWHSKHRSVDNIPPEGEL